MDANFKRIDLDGRISHRRRRRKGRRVWKYFGIFLILMVAFLIWSSISSPTSVLHNVIPRAAGSDIKQTDDRVNILLLGIGGGTHDGPDLTDSIIVASYNLKTNDVTMFSIPRDLWLPSIQQKINAAYTVGLSKDGNGLGYTEGAIGDVMGIPIHYAVVLDFSGFSKAIDLVGGVDVDVPDTFDDYQYPIDGKENDLCGWKEQQMNLTPDQAKPLNVNPGSLKVYVDPTGKIATDSASLDFSCRFEHIHFNQGMTHMDGATALKFVRSRHAIGIEGSDFARSRRQQLVIQAFRSKVFSLSTLANPQKDLELLGTLGDSLKTDIPQGQYLEFYTLAKKVKNTQSYVLGDLGDGTSLFINPPISDKYGGAWVLTPPNDDFSVVKNFVQNALNPLPSPSPTSSPSSSGKKAVK